MHLFGRYDLIVIFTRPCKGELRALPHTCKYANHHRYSTARLHHKRGHGSDPPKPVNKLEKRFIALGRSRTTKGRRDDSAQCLQADAQAIDVRPFRSVLAEDLGSLSASLRMVS